MSEAPDRSEAIPERAEAGGIVPAAEVDAGANTHAGEADAAADAATADGPSEAPAPLTSLSALLGGSFEGGAACAADGTCD